MGATRSALRYARRVEVLGWALPALVRFPRRKTRPDPKRSSEERVGEGVRAPTQASIDLSLALWAAILENHPLLVREIIRNRLLAALEQPTDDPKR